MALRQAQGRYRPFDKQGTYRPFDKLPFDKLRAHVERLRARSASTTCVSLYQTYAVQSPLLDGGQPT